MEYFAHIREDSVKQTVDAHCRRTADYAARALKPVGLQHAGYLAGLLHDAGKYQKSFQQYLYENDNRQKGKVIHSFQGCRMLLEFYHVPGAQDYESLTAEILAYAVGAHHGLFDCINRENESGFRHRTASVRTNYSEVTDNFFRHCANRSEIDQLFHQANLELVPVYEALDRMTAEGRDLSDNAQAEAADQELYFSLGLLARLLSSAVIDGDRRDTAEFMNSAVFPPEIQNRAAFWLPYLERVEAKLDLLPRSSEINQARRLISEECRQAAERPSGLFRLNVPTGSGKTLSSLRFALAHAHRWGKSRIIFTAPLLSILDQNADVIREYLADDTVILEHHSNVIHTEETDDRLDMTELLEDTWDSPVVITSMAQLLLTLFNGKTASIRRFQSLCGSIIIMDEVQNVPNNIISLFNQAVNFLVTVCRASVVLCSATQPNFHSVQHPLMAASDMVPFRNKLWSVFQRTAIQDAGSLRLEEIPAFLLERMHHAENQLVVCNKKAEAEFLFRTLSARGIRCLHLSASMCPAHRREVLVRTEEALKESREGGEKFILISTQVIEAGVDISFACVTRLLAGLENAVQSAGRCNRNGEKQIAPVYLVNCADEILTNLQEIREGKDAALELLEHFRADPKRFEESIASDTAVSLYYDILYRNMKTGYQDYTIKDEFSLFDLLSCNDAFAGENTEQYFLKQAFRTAGALFRVFNDETEDVVVPYGYGEKLIDELNAMPQPPDYMVMQNWLERAKPYTVALYGYQRKALGAVYEKNGVYVLANGYYNSNTGIFFKNETNPFLEVGD